MVDEYRSEDYRCRGCGRWGSRDTGYERRRAEASALLTPYCDFAWINMWAAANGGDRYSEHCRRLIFTWFATHFMRMTRRNRSQVNDLLKRLDVSERAGHQVSRYKSEVKGHFEWEFRRS